MINIKFKKTESSDLEKEIARLFEVMADKQPTDADYEKVADQLCKLYKLKEVDSKSSMSKDVLITALTGIGQILLITNFEHAHALASKSLGFVFKSRA
jgi:hypothetical protein